MQQDTIQIQKRLHRRQVVSGGERRAEPSPARLCDTTDISTEQHAVSSNHTGTLSHFHRAMGEVIRRLFCQRDAALQSSLEEEEVCLQGSDLVQEGLCLPLLSD